MRTTCRKCKAPLIPGDPTRKYYKSRKHKQTGEFINRYMGDCKQCTDERILIAKWKKRGNMAINLQIVKMKRIIKILKKGKIKHEQ
jgi:RNase P subunit RPR2